MAQDFRVVGIAQRLTTDDLIEFEARAGAGPSRLAGAATRTMCRRMNFGGLDLRQAHSQMHRALQTGNAHLD